MDAALMSDEFEPQRRRGISGIVFLACAGVGGAGLALDLLRAPDDAFWIGAMPGARAAIGIGAAVVVIAAAALLRIGLGSRAQTDDGKGARHAGDNP